MKKYLWMSSAAVVNGALRVNKVYTTEKHFNANAFFCGVQDIQWLEIEYINKRLMGHKAHQSSSSKLQSPAF